MLGEIRSCQPAARRLTEPAPGSDELTLLRRRSGWSSAATTAATAAAPSTEAAASTFLATSWLLLSRTGGRGFGGLALAIVTPRAWLARRTRCRLLLRRASLRSAIGAAATATPSSAPFLLRLLDVLGTWALLALRRLRSRLLLTL